MTTCCLTLTSQHSIRRLSFYQLRNLSKIRKCLIQASSGIAEHAFITSKIDYKLQFTAPRMVTRTRKLCEYIIHLTFTGFLLAIMLFLNYFCQFSTHLITFHLAIQRTDLVINALQESVVRVSAAIRTTSKTHGDKAFSVCDPELWNSLPLARFAQVTILSQFKERTENISFYAIFRQ